MWERVTEAGTLRVHADLAAWTLAAPGTFTYTVLAGQLVPGFEWCFPGRVIDAAMIARACDLGYPLLSWGSSKHPQALIAVSA